MRLGSFPGSWLGALPRPFSMRLGVALGLALTGCPGDDGSGDSGGTAAVGTETSSADSSTTANDPTVGATEATTSETDADETTTPPVECDPPCAADEICVEGACQPGPDTTGTPVECGTTFTTRDPACDQCWQDHCCTALQACHGDETVTEPTACNQLDTCINASCVDATTPRELQTCVEASCPELAGEINTWFGLTLCTFNACDEICNPPMG